MTDKAMALKPCHCGAKPSLKLVPASMGDPNLYFILPECRCKHTLTTYESGETAIEQWNRRATRSDADPKNDPRTAFDAGMSLAEIIRALLAEAEEQPK